MPRWGSGRTRGLRAVELRVPARTEALAVVRAMTGTLANYEELDGDIAADLALAVDEACTVLIGIAAEGATLVLVEDPRAHDVNVRVSAACDAPEGDPANVTLSGFSRRVLEALTDKVGTFSEGTDFEEGDSDGPVFGISLTIRRRWASAGR
ncbi:anti-sigma factor [Mycobacterium sp. CBMA247]|nr:anti-sigma factor [Mycolicibacterium sp. CBMA 329]MUL86852.1 anti-sigma factor [Mycolicibacterium sp. CBMA 331]MUL98863.1 anti-sigma factor [Mycolicibacterium sp. CBMA 334]MUM28877.1 anti-sigma factor [Mycolicibacterium sp. CBMA 295]MUM37149.1 anti-sigma factor [Mycolicibacterium sp. CBMA 247]MUM42917.1 anti-sigma factor [Mycolicibacterium sp. CBMA 294]